MVILLSGSKETMLKVNFIISDISFYLPLHVKKTQKTKAGYEIQNKILTGSPSGPLAPSGPLSPLSIQKNLNVVTNQIHKRLSQFILVYFFGGGGFKQNFYLISHYTPGTFIT